MQKRKFDARSGPTPTYQDLFSNPWRYSFIHNFKVHYKASALQALANKVDVSISSTSPQIPATQDIVNEFNQRMQLGNVSRNMRQRFSSASYHITNIEYKESFAFHDPQTAPRTSPIPQAQPQVPTFPSSQPQSQIGMSKFCTGCGDRLPPNSRFCGSCGSAVI